jgi:hypothetical protein
MKREFLSGGHAGRLAWWLAAAGSLAVLLGSGCSSSVETEGSTGSPGGSSTATGGGGGTGGAGGGGSMKMCGGFAGLTCDADEVCDYSDDSCGSADASGVCEPRPDSCIQDCPGVCGCDGNFYCNLCTAHAAGVDTSASMSCAQASGEYSAEAFFGGLDHVLVKKADKARDVCVSLHLARPAQNSPEFAFTMPMDWGVQNAEISNMAADCYAPPGQTMGKTVSATGGMGTISFTAQPGGFIPCNVSVKGSLAFPGGEAWVQPSEALDAVDVVVKNGCL